MEKKKAVKKESKQLIVKVISDMGQGNAEFERDINLFLRDERNEIVRINYVYRNNANVAYVEHYRN